MMRLRLIPVAALLLAACQWLFPLAIPLTVRNYISQARNDVPVQMGIPFPAGKLQVADVPKLTISDSATGQAVPAGIKSTVVWHDGSVRWIRLLFPATLPAAVNAIAPSTRTYMLTDANKNTGGILTATAAGNAVTVVTGPLKFTVKGANFNLIDEAWMDESGAQTFDDAHKIISTGNTGGFVMKVGATTYSSSTTTATVTLYESSAYHAIIKVTGTISQYPFTFYIYAYSGKPYVKIIQRFYYNNADGSSASLVNINDIALTLKTALTSGGTATFSSANGDGDTATTLGAADEGYLYYSVPDYYKTFKGAAKIDSGGSMNLAPGTYGCQTMGWGHVTNGTLGVAGAIRWMWQMAPKNISLLGTGEASLHLWSNKGTALQYYGGTGRTHIAGFAFTSTTAMAKEMFYAVTQPLYAVAPPKWLTAQTKVMGELIPCDTFALGSVNRSMVAQYSGMGLTHGHPARRMVVNGENSYGFVGFGDQSDPVMDCGGRYWSNNYYDFPHNIAQAFLMTGVENNAETGIMHALHLGDINHSSITGQSRTGPSWGNFGDYQVCAIGYSGTSNHYKSQGLFDWANILAEPLMGEMALTISKWAQGYVVGEIRSVGHILEALSSAYAYTNSATWKTSLENGYTSMGVLGNFSGQPFQQAYVGEGIMWTLIEDPSFQTAVNSLQQWADHWAGVYDPVLNTFGDYPDLACGYFAGLSYAHGLWNKPAYATVMTDLWNQWDSTIGKAGNGTLKTFTQEFKAPPHYFRFIKQASYNPLMPDYWNATAIVTGTEHRSGPSPALVALTCRPNPLNASTRLSFSVSERGRINLAVYDVKGQRIISLADREVMAGAYSVEWNTGKGLASGIYYAVLKAGGRQVERKLVLVR
jgi:hypothetical protein